MLAGVTYPMIVDCLGLDVDACAGLEGHPVFEALITSGCSSVDVPDERLLLCAEPERCLEELCARENLHAVCLMPEDSGLSSALASTYRCLLVDAGACPGTSSTTVLALTLSQFFFETQRVVSSLHESLLSGATLTELLDVAAPYLDCPMVMSGVGLKIVACTTRYQPEDTMIVKALEKGYFDEEQTSYFRENGMPFIWNSIRDLYLVETGTDHRDYPIVFYVFRVHDNYYLHLTAHCNLRPPSEGLFDQLRILITAIERYIELNPPSREVFGSGFPALMAQIAQGESTVTPQVREQFRKEGIAAGTPWRLHLVDYGFTSDEQQLAMQTALGLLTAIPEALIAVVDSCALILEPAPNAESPLTRALVSHARAKQARCGVSDAFSGVEHLPQAYRQLKAVQQVMRMQGDAETLRGECSYTDAFPDYFLMASPRDMRLVTDCRETSIPALLIGQDAEKGVDDAQALEVFLRCERKVSLATDRLFLHRNTLLYHIRRVEEQFGISLDDEATRERLLIEFRIIRLSER